MSTIKTEKRLASMRLKYGSDSEEANTVERSTALVKKYSSAVKSMIEQKNELINGPTVLFLDILELMLAQDADIWGSYLLEDGLHLSTQGNEFVAHHLIHLLDTTVTTVESLPSELPWGSQVDPTDYETSFYSHQLHFSNERIGLGNQFFPYLESSNRVVQRQHTTTESLTHLKSLSGLRSVGSFTDINNPDFLFSFSAFIVFLCIALYVIVNYFRNEFSTLNKNN